MQLSIVVGKTQRFDFSIRPGLMAEYIRNFSTVTPGTNNYDSFQSNQTPLPRLPLNSGAVACPGWLMPSLRMRLIIVKTTTFTSSRND